MAELSVAIVGDLEPIRQQVLRWGALSGVRVGALICSEGAAAAELANTLPDCAAFVGLSAALKAEAFSLVDVCLPIGRQAEAVETALQRGVPALCELPVGENVEIVESLVSLSETQGVSLFPAFGLRFHPAVRFLKDLLENDDLGTPMLTRIHLSPTPAFPLPLEALDLFRFLIAATQSRESALQANVLTTVSQPSRKASDVYAVQLRAGDRLGMVTTVGRQEGASNQIEIFGSAGFAQTDLDYGQTLYGTALSSVPQTRAESEPASPLALYSEIADTLRGLQAPPVFAHDLRAVWRLLEHSPSMAERSLDEAS